MKHTISIRWLAYITIEAIATFLVIYEAHTITFVIVKAKILVLTKWPYSPPNYVDH